MSENKPLVRLGKGEIMLKTLFYSACLAIYAAAILIPHYPPMVDLPQHIAAVATLDKIFDGTYVFADHFDFNWLTPYWLGYLLVWIGSLLFGYVWSAKLVVTASILAFVLACTQLRRYVGAPGVFDWLFLTVPLGFAYQWGMLNFIVAAPIGVFAILQFLRYIAGQTRSWSIVLLMLVLLLAHALMMAFVAATCALLALQNADRLSMYVRRLIPLLSPLPAFLIWFFITWKPSSVESWQWDLGWHRVAGLLPGMVNLPYSTESIFVSIGLLALPFAFARPVYSLSHSAPLMLYACIMLFVPKYFMGNFYTAQRFDIFGVLLYALMFAGSTTMAQSALVRVRNLLRLVAPLVALLAASRSTINSSTFDREARGFRSIVATMQAEAPVLGLISARDSMAFSRPVFLHFPAWYQVEKAGMVDYSFAYWPGMNLTYRRDRLPLADETLLWFPQRFDWQIHNADRYRYFIVKGSKQFPSTVLGKHKGQVTLNATEDDWYLFENTKFVGFGQTGAPSR